MRHYYGLRVQCNNDGCLSLSFPSYSIKQTSLQELSWMSLYLVYLYLESLGVVHGDDCEIRERSSDIVDPEQVLIHFISKNDRSASAIENGRQDSI